MFKQWREWLESRNSNSIKQKKLSESAKNPDYSFDNWIVKVDKLKSDIQKSVKDSEEEIAKSDKKIMDLKKDKDKNKDKDKENKKEKYSNKSSPLFKFGKQNPEKDFEKDAKKDFEKDTKKDFEKDPEDDLEKRNIASKKK